MRLTKACEVITASTGHYIDRDSLRYRIKQGQLRGGVVDGVYEVCEEDVREFCKLFKGKHKLGSVKRGKDKVKRKRRKKHEI